jgi:hypothetical protein
MAKHTGSVVPALYAGLLLAFTTTPAASPAQAASDCRAAPNAQAPKGQHWYYRIDRASGRKCWYVGQQGQKVRQAAPAAPPVERTAERLASLPRQTAVSEEREQASPDIWPAPPDANAAPMLTAEVPTTFPSRAAETSVSGEANLPAPIAADTPTEPRAAEATDAAQQAAVPAEAAGSAGAPLSVFIVVIASLGIIGFLLRAMLKLAPAGRIRLQRRAEVAPQRPSPDRRIASPNLAPENEEPPVDDVLRRLLRSLERRAA